MPKAEQGSIKAIGKQIKSKGLQKLKYYCQICEKQCRDANGFKCHISSDSHMRSMSHFANNASHIMDRYSKEFETAYLDTLRMRHSTTRSNANLVYQQLIQDKHHIHMNSTIWSTLSAFCMYLGKSGKCVVEETDQGWYITYIERDAGILDRAEKQRRKEIATQDAEQVRQQQQQSQRIEAMKALERIGMSTSTQQPTSIQEDGNTANTSIRLVNTKSGANSKKRKAMIQSTLVFDGSDDDDNDDDNNDDQAESKTIINNSRTSNWNSMMLLKHQSTATDNSSSTKIDNSAMKKMDDAKQQTKKQKTSSAPPCWLYRNILVRVVGTTTNGVLKKPHHPPNKKYYRCKGIVDTVNTTDHVATQIMIVDDKSAGDKLYDVHESYLETVTPSKKQLLNSDNHTSNAKKVRIVRGTYTGKKGYVVSLNKLDYTATIQIVQRKQQDDRSKHIVELQYDDFSVIA